jgi:hypothetical protein
LGSGSYDTPDNFEFVAREGIKAEIEVREDSDPNCGGDREEVGAYLRALLGWKSRVGYGQRWMVGRSFSGFKRLFGEVVYAKRFEWVVKEIELKVWDYNLTPGLTCGPLLSPPGGLTSGR